MIHGYAILENETETFGLPAWRSDDFVEYSRISKVRLFSSRKERDNAIKIEIANGRAERDRILPFATKGKQGKLRVQGRPEDGANSGRHLYRISCDQYELGDVRNFCDSTDFRFGSDREAWNTLRQCLPHKQATLFRLESRKVPNVGGPTGSDGGDSDCAFWTPVCNGMTDNEYPL